MRFEGLRAWLCISSAACRSSARPSKRRCSGRCSGAHRDSEDESAMDWKRRLEGGGDESDRALGRVRRLPEGAQGGGARPAERAWVADGRWWLLRAGLARRHRRWTQTSPRRRQCQCLCSCVFSSRSPCEPFFIHLVACLLSSVTRSIEVISDMSARAPPAQDDSGRRRSSKGRPPLLCGLSSAPSSESNCHTLRRCRHEAKCASGAAGGCVSLWWVQNITIRPRTCFSAHLACR